MRETDLTWVILTKLPTWEEFGEANDVQMLQPVAECILLDIAQLVLVGIRYVRLFLVEAQAPDRLQLVGGNVAFIHLEQHGAACVTDTLYYAF